MFGRVAHLPYGNLNLLRIGVFSISKKKIFFFLLPGRNKIKNYIIYNIETKKIHKRGTIARHNSE